MDRFRSTPIVVTLAAVALAGGAWWLAQRGIAHMDDRVADAIEAPAPDVAVVAAKLRHAEAELVAAEAAVDAVRADAKLAAVEARSQQRIALASLTVARLGVESAAEQISETEAKLAGSLIDWNRARYQMGHASELNSIDAISPAEVEAAQNGLDDAESRVAQLQTRLAALRGFHKQLAAQASEAAARTRLRAISKDQIAGAQARLDLALAQVEVARTARDEAALELSNVRTAAPTPLGPGPVATAQNHITH